MRQGVPHIAAIAHVLAAHAVVLCAVGQLRIGAVAAAEEPSKLFFETDVAQIFKVKCSRCHGDETQKSELNLSSAEGIRKGGSSGEVITPGKPDVSPLYEMARDDLMPPEGEGPRLTPEEIDTIRQWIESGARFNASAGKQKEVSEQATVSQHDVMPIFLLRCTVCHGLRQQEGGLDLRTRTSMLKGGNSGPAIVLGAPDDSLLIKRIRAGEMPPPRRVAAASVKPVPQPEFEKLVTWIKAAAPEARDEPDVATTEPDPLVSDEDRKFWAFQPPRLTNPPSVPGAALVRNPIDAFVLARLEAKGLSLAPAADRRTLARRAHFDLTGLLPTPEEIDTFLSDASQDAYEKLIDGLLASPHYGERWGRHWLDVAGYSDSEGKTGQDMLRTSAWRYRDYVIRAFNADKPYDRFLLEQIAGDELADYEHAPEITAEIYDNLVATGFLRMAADPTWSNITDFVPDRLEVIADEIQVLSSGVMGLTMNCARCHTHKFDPIPHRDYFRLAAVLKSGLDEHDWLGPTARQLPLVTTEEKHRTEAHNGPLDQQVAALKSALAEETKQARTKLFDARLVALPEVLQNDVRKAFAIGADKRNEVEKYLTEKFKAQLEIDETELAKADADYRMSADEKQTKIRGLETKKLPPLEIRALWDRGAPSPTYMLKRGDYLNPGRLVGPGVPSVLSDGKTPFKVLPPWPGAKSTGRRLAARWLVQPDHPLTARVMVNRVWSHHFGRGIVASLGNFGRSGTPPSHPEMLDWLAIDFVKHGWSVKHLHRLMMTSQTYRQSSAFRPDAQLLDPDSSLLSRMSLHRAEGEVIYDSILLASGTLDATPFGPPDGVDVRGDGLVTAQKTEKGWRRSIYVQQRRTQIPTVLDSFDFPQMSPNCLERRNSTVAPQALYLMNNSSIHGFSQRIAERIRQEAGADPARQIDRAFQIALSRNPTAAESQISRETLIHLTAEWSKQQPVARQLVVDSTCSTWIRESLPTNTYETDRIWVTSANAIDKGRRYGLVEFDLKPLAGLDINRVHLELGVMTTGEMKQTAVCVPANISGTTWSSYQGNKAPAAQSFESLGRFALHESEGAGGVYLASADASTTDLALLTSKLRDGEKLALALLAAEDGERYQREWDDGISPGTRGKRPRLVVHYSSPSPDEAATSALANICHALLTASEFVYID